MNSIQPHVAYIPECWHFIQRAFAHAETARELSFLAPQGTATGAVIAYYRTPAPSVSRDVGEILAIGSDWFPGLLQQTPTAVDKWAMRAVERAVHLLKSQPTPVWSLQCFATYMPTVDECLRLIQSNVRGLHAITNSGVLPTEVAELLSSRVPGFADMFDVVLYTYNKELATYVRG